MRRAFVCHLSVLTLAAATLPAQVQRDPTRPAVPSPQTVRDPALTSTTGTAVISGTVMSEESPSRPIRRVMVTLNGTAGGRTTATGDDGRYVFAGLPAGRFTIAANKPGWVAGYYGAKRAGRGPGTTIALTDAQRVTADVRLVRGAVISGRIIDQLGQPQVGARVQVMEYRSLGNDKVLLPSHSFGPAGNSTDDRGEYRLFGLAPGNYVVSASPSVSPLSAAARTTTAEEVQWALRQGPAAAAGPTPPAPAPGPMVALAPVFYPGSSDPAAASQITVSAGEERSGVDFTLVPMAMTKVEGTLSRSDGGPIQGAQVSLSSAEATLFNPLDLGSSRVSVDPNGRFTFASVRPGAYRLLARAASQPATPPVPGAGIRPGAMTSSLDLYAVADVVVQGQDIDNLSLMLQPGSTVSGRVIFEATTLTPPEQHKGVRLQMMPPVTNPLAMRMSETQVHFAPASPDGTFTMSGVTPGKYVLTAYAPRSMSMNPDDQQGWTVKSVTVGRQNVTDASFEVRTGEQLSDVVVTLTDVSSEISGTIFDGVGRPAPGYTIFVFPVERSGWLVTSRGFRPPAQPSTDGKFRVSGLPAGSYYLAALTEIDEFDLIDESFLEQLAAASIKVTLKTGEKRVQDVKIR